LRLEERTRDYLERYVGAGRPASSTLSPRCRPPGGRRDTIGLERAAAIDRLVVGMARASTMGMSSRPGSPRRSRCWPVALAKATRARRATYINCVGAVDPPLASAAWSSVDPRLLDGCRDRVTLRSSSTSPGGDGSISCIRGGAGGRGGAFEPDLHRRLRAAEGEAAGSGGSSAMRPFVRKVVVLLSRHSTQSLVARVDFATSVPSQRNVATTA